MTQKQIYLATLLGVLEGTPGESLYRMGETIPYGLVIVGQPEFHSEDEFQKFLSEVGITEENLSKTMYENVEDVTSRSRLQLLVEQIIHYITTYGTNFQIENFYIENEKFLKEYTYTKEEIEQIYQQMKGLKIYRVLSKNEIRKLALEFIYKVTALKDQTLKQIEFLMYEYRLDEMIELSKVQSNDLKVYLMEQFNVVPDTLDDWLRMIFKIGTGRSGLFRRSQFYFHKMKENFNRISDYIRKTEPIIRRRFIESYASSALRNKEFLLFLKKEMRSERFSNLTNIILRKAKKLHRPVWNKWSRELSNPEFEISTKRLLEKLYDESLMELFRVYKALKERLVLKGFYRIILRDGLIVYWEKEWTERKEQIIKERLTLVEKIILFKLREKFGGKKIYIPENLLLGLPITEKQFLGNLPEGTVWIGNPEKAYSFGVYWEDNDNDQNVDIDFSGILYGERQYKIGWDGEFYSDEKNFVYSGDITDSSHGASEFIFIKPFEENWKSVLKANLYSSGISLEKTWFKFVISEMEINKKGELKSELKGVKFSDLKDVVFYTDKQYFTTREQNVGFVLSNDEQIYFRVYLGGGTKRASSVSDKEEKYLELLSNVNPTEISLNWFFYQLGLLTNDENSADINLNPAKYSKGELINLFT